MKRILLLLCGGIIFAHTLSAQCSFTANVSTIPACYMQPSGSAYVNVTGGTGPFSYHWLAPLNQTGPFAGGIPGGTYQVAVIDSSTMCDDTIVFTINMYPQLQIAVAPFMVSCSGACDGSAVVTVMGGVAGYTYSWSNGATTPSINNLCPGVYQVTVTDGAGCVASQIVTIVQPSPITLSATSSPATCGLCDGNITLSVGGGSAPYQYSYDGGVTYTVSSTNNAACAGAYVLEAMDANGCVGSTNVVVTTTGGFSVGFDTLVVPGCGMCNGAAVVIPSGGLAPYSYAWSGVSSSTDSLGMGFCTATVNVTDANGCVTGAVFSPSFTPIPGITVTHTSTPESMAGSSDASIDVTVSGAAGALTYLWSNGATTQDIFSVTNGTYGLSISDGAGNCEQFSFTITSGAGQFGSISGTVYNDNNMNCTQDVGEPGVSSGYVVAQPGGYYGYINLSGAYTIWAPYGTYTVTHSPGYGAGPAPSCATSYSVPVTFSIPTVNNINFADTLVNAADGYVSLSCNGIVPGFNGIYNLYAGNILPTAANASVMFIMPNNLTYLSASITPSTISGDTLWFNLTGLVSGSPQYIAINFNTPVGTVLGSSITACATISLTSISDFNPLNDNVCYSRTVTGSFDPNDKSVSPTGENATGDVELTEDTFTYLIRFQNTGNGPAVNIHVDDTISNLLDMSTFEMLGASHTYNIITKPSNVIVWEFDNINLPDSGSNEPASHGWIQFKIKTKPNMVIGNVINNTADIYFDFNAPVITNTTVNTYVLPDYIAEIEKQNSLNVYPNPVNDLLTVVHPEKGKGAMKISVMDVSGRVMQNLTLVGTQMTIDVKDLAPGMYIIQATNNQINYSTRFVRR